jgi:hypothetical protein
MDESAMLQIKWPMVGMDENVKPLEILVVAQDDLEVAGLPNIGKKEFGDSRSRK